MALSNGNNAKIKVLTEEFGNFRFQYYSSDDRSFISCIACWIKTSPDLEKFWNPIQNILSVSFKPENKTLRWNLYLAFICEEKIDPNLKQIIQNNKYYARKIILDSSDLATEENTLRALNDELFGEDLLISKPDLLPPEQHKSSIAHFITEPDMADKASRIRLLHRLIEEMKNSEDQ